MNGWYRDTLRGLVEPRADEALTFSCVAHSYRVIADGDVWEVFRDADSRRIAALGQTGSGWVIIPSEGDGEWHDLAHSAALEARVIAPLVADVP